MKVSKLHRALCLVLACIVLSLCFIRPVTVKATGVETAVVAGVAVNPAVAIAVILVALGIACFGDDFVELAEDIAASIPSKFTTVTNDETRVNMVRQDDVYYVPYDLVQWVNDLIWGKSSEADGILERKYFDFSSDESVLSKFYAIASDDAYRFESSLSTYLRCYCFVCEDGEYLFMFSDSEMISLGVQDGAYSFTFPSLYSSVLVTALGNDVFYRDYDAYHTSSIVGDYELIAGQESVVSSIDVGVGDVSEDLTDDVYDPWTDTVVEFVVNDGTPDQYLPVTMVETVLDAADLTQDDVQAGEATVVEDVVVTDAVVSTPTYATSVLDWLADIFSGIFDLSGIASGIKSLITSIRDILSNLEAWLQGVIDGILAGIEAIFVPTDDYLSGKLESLRSNFGFVDSLITTAESIADAFNSGSSEPPVIYAELSNAEGSYYFGDRAIVLDLRWYSRYKPTVDTVISAFLWAVFVWRMFMKLPGIINGQSSDFVLRSLSGAGRSGSSFDPKHDKK